MSDKPPRAVETRRARIAQSAASKQVPLQTIIVTIALVVVVYLTGKLLYRLRDIVLLMLVGGFLALILNPLVAALQRWKVPRRGVAVAIVTLWALLILGGLAVAFGYPLVNGITHLADNLPAYVDKATHGKGWIGRLVRRYHVQAWVRRNTPKLVSLAEGLGKPAFALGKGAASVMIALASTFVFVVLLLLEAPKLRRAILALLSAERAERYTRVGAAISRSVSGYVLGDVLTSFIAGTVVFVTLTILSVPFPLLWGLWVAIVDFLPTIGGALAGIPTVLFALAHSLSAGVITAVVFLVYTQIENHVLNPVVMSRTVKVNPLLVLVAVFVGADIGSWVGGLFGGFVAALLAIPIAGAIQVITREVWIATAPVEQRPAGVSQPSSVAVSVEVPPGDVELR